MANRKITRDRNRSNKENFQYWFNNIMMKGTGSKIL